tara:strand:+ start:1821 stop:2507 length:687 start_codon:yes stop_codon:yes gene_type:complete
MGGFGGGGGGAPAVTATPAVTPTPATTGPTVPDGSMAKTYITNNYGETPDNQGEYIRKEASSSIPGMGDDDLTMVLGGEGASQMFQPFEEQRAGASFLGDQYEQAEGLPSMDAVVANQNLQATGEGGEGFGNRIIGGEAGVEGGVMPEGSMEQTNVVGTEMASDVATTNEQPLPGQAVIDDLDYTLATAGGGQNQGFVPGSRPASLQGTGSLSRNLSSPRTGFGRRMS